MSEGVITSAVGRALSGLLLLACGSVAPSNVSGGDASRDVRTRVDAGRDGGDASPDAHTHVDAGQETAAGLHEAGTDGSPCGTGEPGVLCLAATPPARQNGPLAVDDANVYWGENGPSDETSFIASLPRAGGAVTTLAASVSVALATDGVNLYWGHPNPPNPVGELLVVPVAGGQVTTLATGALPGCIVLDEDNVYWTDEYEGTVSKVAKSGGPTLTLAPINWPVDTNGYAIAVDSSSVYWVADGLFKVGKGGGAVTTLLSSDAGATGGACRSLGVVGGSLVALLQPPQSVDSFDAETPYQVVTVPSSGAGTPRAIVPGGSARMIAAGPTTVYWEGLSTGIQIRETPIDGGPSTLLATPAAYLVSDMVLASDGTLYWLTNSQLQSIRP